MYQNYKVGIEDKDLDILVPKLQNLLANYYIYYQNLRTMHWLVQGKNFFELHAKFEEYYTDALLKIDEVAERMLTIGVKPITKYSKYLSESDIKEVEDGLSGTEYMEKLQVDIRIILDLERKILDSVLEDEGTSAMISDYIRFHEKQYWMVSAYLQK